MRKWAKYSKDKQNKNLLERPEETGVEVVKVGSKEYEVFIEDIFRIEDDKDKKTK